MNSISTNITYNESIFSETAIRKNLDNTPSDEELLNMKYVAEECFEPCRVYFDKPIKITSFFRSKEVNKAIGGSKTSDHINGCSIDIQATKGFTNLDIFNYFKDRKDEFNFDQLIWEYGGKWVHISKRRLGTNRKMVFNIT